MKLNRRDALKSLLALPAVAVAAKMGAPEYMGEEIKEQLAEELIREPVTVGYSDVKVFDNRPIFTSTARMESYWTDEISKKLGARTEPEVRGIRRAAHQMVREMDKRLQDAEVTEDQKVIMDIPMLRNVRTKYDGSKDFELVSSVVAKKGLFGNLEYRVGYEAPEEVNFVNSDGTRMERDWAPEDKMGEGTLTDLSGQKNYAVTRETKLPGGRDAKQPSFANRISNRLGRIVGV